MSTWPDVVAAALVGTERRQLTGVSPEADMPVEVLDRAAAWAAYRRAGTLASPGPERRDPAPVDDRPRVGDAAARRLASLLDGEHGPFDAASRAAVLDEWLTAAVDRGRLVPPELLPILLDLGRRRTEVRELIASAGGARVRWLADQNPDWRYLTRIAYDPTLDPDTWQRGNRAQRIGYLRALRQRDPESALALLTADWGTLTPEEREAFLPTLETGLGPADEDLLEQALDDRRRDVRDEAAHLLSQLPDTAYGRRMAVRARQYVDNGLILPPADFDAGMRRDGLNPKPPPGTGVRAWWLEEVLARTPLATWPPVDEFAEVSIEDEWAPTVHRGLARAAAAQRDAVWASYLLDVLGSGPRDQEVAVRLYPVLDTPRLVARALAAMRAGTTQVWAQLLVNCPGPWPDELARTVLGGLGALTTRRELAGDLFQLCRLAAVRLPVSFAAEARACADRVNQAVPNTRPAAMFDSLAAALRFRHEMMMEIG